MNCQFCGQPATFQCRLCWAFYCREHQVGLDHPCTSGFWSQSKRWGIAFSAGTDFEEVRKKFDEAQAQPDPAFRGMQLKRVIPVVQSQTIGKTEVIITSVDAFEDGFVVYDRIRRAAADPGSDDFETLLYMEAEALWSATVDNGDELFALSGAGWGSSVTRRGWTVFIPEFQPNAKTLTLSAPAIAWKKPGEDPLRDPLEVQEGPWRFEIELT